MKKKIIVTGASKGIGKATVEMLSSQGNTIHMIARSEDELRTIAKDLKDVSWSRADVSDHSEISIALKKGIEEMKGVDVVVNNAGLGFFDPIDQGSIEDWHQMIDVNIKGALSVIHTCLPHLIKSNGHIINITSVASHLVFPNSGIYCATKHALLAISESLRIELAGKLRVSSVSPGAVNTSFIEQTKNEELLKDLKPYFENSMKPMDIAKQIDMVINAPENTVISEVIIRPNKNSSQS